MLNPIRFSKMTRWLMCAVAALLIVPLYFAPAQAQNRTLDGPRAAGTVGERFDGFAVVRDKSQAATLTPLVDSVNAERQKVYAQRAAGEKVPVDQIGKIYAEQILGAAPTGTWFLKASGEWVQKYG